MPPSLADDRPTAALDWADDPRPDRPGRRGDRLLGPAPGRRGEKAAVSGGLVRSMRTGTRRSLSTPASLVAMLRLRGARGRRRAGDGVRGLTFPEAVRWLAEQAGIVPVEPPPPREAEPPEAPGRWPPQGRLKAPPEQPSGLPLADALKLVEEAAARLWTPEGGTPWTISGAVD